MNFVILTVSLIGLIAASVSDLRKREVPDWLNYGMIVCGFFLNLLYTIYMNDFRFLFYSALGFTGSFALAYIMFYSGQWGGGDSKMIMALGTLLGLDIASSFIPFIAILYVNILFIGAFYGIVWIFSLSFRNFNGVKKRMTFYLHKYKKSRLLTGLVLLVFIGVILLLPQVAVQRDLKYLLAVTLIFLYFMQYLWLIVKAVEDISMIKYIAPDKLTEGDWIVDDVVIDKEYVCGPKDLGIKKYQIKKLMQFKKEKKIEKIKIKEGIPFIPSFLLAFLYSLVFKNILIFNFIIK
ncbi:prepilin peptidase [Candidatus Woesearchaeota archaeon]|nr:prepilin peptidase [Candidatus Woesearchaeota archaeon]